MMATQLDHIILLLSPADFNNLPPWLSDNFTIINGGKHSKGTSQNKLIIFEDGSYLELFSWIDPQPEDVETYADFPSWAGKPDGHIIDWALTGPDAHAKYSEITAQIQDLEATGEQVGVTYDQPKEGGRRRMDGKVLRWYATRPRQSDTTPRSSRIDVPFFCHDVSDRSLRVPYTRESSDDWPRIVTHPCGASGVQSIAINVPAGRLDLCAKMYEGILGTQRDRQDEVRSSTTSFTIASPAQSRNIPGRSQCTVSLLPVGGDKADIAGQPGTSIQGLVLWTSKQDWKGQRLNASGFGTEITLG